MADLKLKFKMPDDETLAEYISIKGEKGERGDPTKTSQLENDSDFTTNAALNAGLATKANATTVQALSSQVNTNKNAISALNQRKIAIRKSVGATPQYALVATLWARSNNGSAGSFTIHGRIGGYQSNRTNHVDLTIGNRGGIQARGSFYGNSPQDENNWVDVVVYYDEQTDTDSIYLCVKGYAALNVDIAPTSPITILYDEEAWSTDVPSGTLAYSLLADDTFVQKNIGGTISANITGDAGTVNGHTVNEDVPSGAVFTDTIYDDTGVYAAIATKASTTDVASTYATKTEVQSVASGSPLVASSISGMTDTSRVYVNTSDGKWYYYNGSAWTVGGTYQASEVANLTDSAMAPNGLTTKALAFYKGYNLKDDHINQRFGWIQSPMQLQQNGYIAISGVSANNKCVTTIIPANSYIRIEKSNTSGRFRVALSSVKPANGVTATIIFEDTTKTSYTFYNTTAAWLIVYYSHTTDVGDATIDVYVDNRNDVKETVRSDTLGVFETVDADNLYIDDLKVVNYGTDTAAHYYRYGNINNYRSYVFPLDPDTVYNIVKTGGNRMRVCLWRNQPIPASNGTDINDSEAYFSSHPSAVVIDDDSATSCSFNSGNYLWCTILYSNAAEDAQLTITTAGNTKRRLARHYSSDLVPVAKPIYPQWDKWSDVRYYYGFDKNTQPIFNTVKGVLESDTMISVRGGKGRWNSAFAGGHVFEGWSKDELFRLTMLIGKFSQAMACIQTYSPAGLSEASRRFGWVKVGSDEQNKGTDFAKGWTKFYTPVTLQSRSTAPTSVEDCDLNPQLSSYSDNVPVGTMYYDSGANKVRVYTPSGWKYLKFED